MSVIYKRTTQKKIVRVKRNWKISPMLLFNVITIAISALSIIANVVLTWQNITISREALNIQETLYNYPASVIGVQREIPLIKYERSSGTAKVTVVIISPHSGYFNLSLYNFTMIEANLNTSFGNNEVFQEQPKIFQPTSSGSNHEDIDVDIWARLYPAEEYLPPKATAARFPAGSLIFEIDYYDSQTGNTTQSMFWCSLWVSVNEPDS